MEHARHVFRVLFVLLVVAAAGTVGRSFAIPDSFGARGHYRWDNVAEQMDHKVMHGGTVSCAGCHEEKLDKTEGKNGHKKVNCEVCHGPLALHANDKDKIADAPVNKSFRTCEWCHREVVGRPKGFPQLDLEAHVSDADYKLEGAVCLECHNAHAPGE